MKKIVVSTIVKAKIEKVWDAWTHPQHITQWNFANDDWCCPSAKNDLKPGGNFSWRMEAKDGSLGFDLEGTYDQIREHERILYNLSDGRMVDLQFNPIGDEVILSQAFEAENENSEEDQRAGWQAILNNFKKYVESQ